LGERNVIEKEDENIPKYNGLRAETQCVWNVKTKVIPVIAGKSGTI
jgi:hypothetical protein